MTLSAKRLAFCREYTIDHNATKAAIRAGYVVNSAHVQGSRLLSDDNVNSHIEAIEAENAVKHGVTVEGLTADLRAAYALAMTKNNTSAAVSAIAGIAKLHGLETGPRDNGNDAVNYVVEAPKRASTTGEWLDSAGKPQVDGTGAKPH